MVKAKNYNLYSNELNRLNYSLTYTDNEITQKNKDEKVNLEMNLACVKAKIKTKKVLSKINNVASIILTMIIIALIAYISYLSFQTKVIDTAKIIDVLQSRKWKLIIISTIILTLLFVLICAISGNAEDIVEIFVGAAIITFIVSIGLFYILILLSFIIVPIIGVCVGIINIIIEIVYLKISKKHVERLNYNN